MTRQLKDVGEYFDQAQRMWERHGCDAEPLLPSGQLFEYELNERGKYTGRGHLSGRSAFRSGQMRICPSRTGFSLGAATSFDKAMPTT
jgi:hypothetical protein